MPALAGRTRSPESDRRPRLILWLIADRITHAGCARRRASISRADLRWTPSGRARESGTSSTVGRVQKHRETSPTPPPRSTVLDAARQRVAGLAHGPDRRAP